MPHNCHTSSLGRLLFGLFATLIFGTAAEASNSKSAALAWDADPTFPTAGYRVYYGTVSGQYTQQIDVGNSTTADVPNLQPGVTYYFEVKAYDASNAESSPSNETSFLTPSAPPVAVDDEVLITTKKAVSIDVLANDQSTGNLSVVAVTQPAGGTTRINSDGTITFTPTGAFTGQTVFSYTISDGSSTASASVTVSNLYYAEQGGFAGLISNPTPAFNNIGSARFQLISTGRFTGKIVLGKTSASVSGTFDANGNATISTKVGGQPAVVTLALDAQTDRILGSVTVSGFTSAVTADPTPYSASNPAPQAGVYTAVVFPGENQIGNGYGRITVQPSGTVQISGHLADGTSISGSSVMLGNGSFPLSIALTGNGHLSGMVSFQNITTPGSESDLNGSLQWLVPSGSISTVDLEGSAYTAPSTNPLHAALAFQQKSSNGQVTISGGGLRSTISQVVTLSASDKVVPVTGVSDKLTGSIAAKTGLFSGRFFDGTKNRNFAGAVLQKRSSAAGYFLGAKGSGAINLSQAL